MSQSTFHIGITALLSITVTFLGCNAFDDNPLIQIAVLDCGNSRSMHIKVDSAWEVTRGIYYEVRVGDSIVIPECACSTFRQSDSRFTLATVNDTEIVGVIQHSGDKQYLIAIHDFSTNESWPHIGSTETPLDGLVKERKKKLWKLFRQGHPNRFIDS